MSFDRSGLRWLPLWIFQAGLLVGCQQQAAPPPVQAPATMTVASPAFEAGQPIPKRYTGDGQDLSPALKWSSLPDGAVQLALIVDDPDAPRADPWVHWVIYHLPAALSELPEGVEKKSEPVAPPGARQGKNSWGRVGYNGPHPPKGHGVHHYHFRLYALDAELDLPAGLTKRQLLEKISGHVLAQGELIGTYER